MSIKSVFAAVLISAVVLLASGIRSAFAFPISDPDFQSPTVNSTSQYAYPAAGWLTSSTTGGNGVFDEGSYTVTTPDPVGFTQAGYINGWIAQQIGVVMSNPTTYTIGYDLWQGNTTVELVQGTPTGTVLASADSIATGNSWTQFTKTLVPVGGTPGQPLFLEFMHDADGSSQTFITGITGVTPEPSSFILGGLGLIGLVVAARRRRKA